MYTENDYQENRAQLKKRLLLSVSPAAVLLLLSIVSFVLRLPQVLTMVLCILGSCGFIFAYSMLIAPVIAYGKHINHALHGRTREIEGTFMVMEAEAVGRDGVQFYPLTLNVGDCSKEADDRLFYFDANLPRPDWQQGDRLHFVSYDNRVTQWKKL